MKKFLKTEKAICRTPSAVLDSRIMLAAKIAAAHNRSRRNFCRFFTAGGAAAALLISGAFFLTNYGSKPAMAEEDLLAMNDWSGFEQASYNLNHQLSSEEEMLPDYSDLQNI